MIPADADRMGAQGWVGPYTEWAIKGTIRGGSKYVVIAEEQLAMADVDRPLIRRGTEHASYILGCDGASDYVCALDPTDRNRCYLAARDVAKWLVFVCLQDREHPGPCGWIHALAVRGEVPL